MTPKGVGGHWALHTILYTVCCSAQSCILCIVYCVPNIVYCSILYTGLEACLEEAGLEEAGLEETGLEEAGFEEVGLEEAGLGGDMASRKLASFCVNFQVKFNRCSSKFWSDPQAGLISRQYNFRADLPCKTSLPRPAAGSCRPSPPPPPGGP